MNESFVVVHAQGVWFAVLAGYLLAVAGTAVALPQLRRMKLRQYAYEDAPRTHQIKTGTPTMGGIAFVVALVPLFVLPSSESYGLFALVLACAAIGFWDDYSAIRRGKNAGLRARTKYVLTAIVAIAFLEFCARGTANADVIFRAGNYVLSVPHVVWLILGILAVSGTIHAVNLTDGLDGLATGVIIGPLVAFAWIAAWNGRAPQAIPWLVTPIIACMLGIGACLGFLVFNRHPAKIFMGDTGSLALGALLSGIAILSGEMLLLVLIGGVFVAEALSVIIQVTYFKRTGGKRIFKMSPLHHHFELSGWPETAVTTRFWLASALCSLAGAAVVYGVGAAHVR